MVFLRRVSVVLAFIPQHGRRKASCPTPVPVIITWWVFCRFRFNAFLLNHVDPNSLNSHSRWLNLFFFYIYYLTKRSGWVIISSISVSSFIFAIRKKFPDFVSPVDKLAESCTWLSPFWHLVDQPAQPPPPHFPGKFISCNKGHFFLCLCVRTIPHRFPAVMMSSGSCDFKWNAGFYFVGASTSCQ